MTTPATGNRTALLLMDVQHNHLTHIPEDYLPRAAHALRTARTAGIPVIHIALHLRPGHIDTHPRNKIFGSLPHHLYTADDTGAAFPPDVAPDEDEIVVHKNRVSAFSGNNLRQILDTQDIGHLALAGIATSGIVLSTALEAADHDYAVTVLTDACADPDPSLHDTLVDKVFAQRGRIATTDTWAEQLTN